jgi:6-phosphofructokinase 1
MDTLVGAVIKRLANNRNDGMAILAEGLLECLTDEDLASLERPDGRDQHGGLRFAEVNLAEELKRRVGNALQDYGLKGGIVAKNIGYELRCVDPIPFDMDYTRDLGYCAARFLIEGGGGAMVSIQGGRFRPIPFASIMDTANGRTRVRMVDTDSDRYRIALSYMVRLKRDDFDDAHELAKLAATVHMTPDAFRSRYEYVTEAEPESLSVLSRMPPPQRYSEAPIAPTVPRPPPSE